MEINNKLLSQIDLIDQYKSTNQPNNASKKEKIHTVAENFSSIFINELLQSVRKEKICDKSLFSNTGTDLSKKMYFEQISHVFASGSGFGLSDQVAQEIESKEV